jgi:hypothetical protein
MDIKRIILEEIGLRTPKMGDKLMYNSPFSKDTPKMRVITITGVNGGNVVFERNGNSYTFSMGEFNSQIQKNLIEYNDSVPSPSGPRKGEIYLGKTNDIRIEVIGIDEDRNSIYITYNDSDTHTKYLNLAKIWIDRGDWVLIESP